MRSLCQCDAMQSICFCQLLKIAIEIKCFSFLRKKKLVIVSFDYDWCFVIGQVYLFNATLVSLKINLKKKNKFQEKTDSKSSRKNGQATSLVQTKGVIILLIALPQRLVLIISTEKHINIDIFQPLQYYVCVCQFFNSPFRLEFVFYLQ